MWRQAHIREDAVVGAGSIIGAGAYIGAGVRLDYDRTSPEALGAAMLEHLSKPVHSAEMPLDGTDRAARLIADLL